MNFSTFDRYSKKQTTVNRVKDKDKTHPIERLRFMLPVNTRMLGIGKLRITSILAMLVAFLHH
ncbi:MAG: hypothetical protein OQK51_12895 [Kangiellaceae bacterium]|nr:hypothetical protein [Kangiellaceae bacterium]